MEEPGVAAMRATRGDPARAIGRLRGTYASGVTRPLSWRRSQLAGLRRLVTAGEARLLEALAADLGKPAHEGWLTDLAFVTGEIDYTARHLGRWIRDERVRVPFVLRPDRARIVREPLGVVLVVAAWNYPIQLSLAPVVGSARGGELRRDQAVGARTGDVARSPSSPRSTLTTARSPWSREGRKSSGPRSMPASTTSSSPGARRPAGSSSRRPRRRSPP